MSQERESCAINGAATADLRDTHTHTRSTQRSAQGFIIDSN